MAKFPEDIAKLLDAPLRNVSGTELRQIASEFCSAARARAPVATSARAQVLVAGLVRARMFDDAILCARVAEDAGQSSSMIAKLHLQSLIDSGKLSEADSMLAASLNATPSDDPEYLEIEGLGGRLAKQKFVNRAVAGGGPGALLQEAVDRYLVAYERNEARPAWHGINVVALLARAERDRIQYPARVDYSEIAASIVRQVEARAREGNADHWDAATAAEAELALGHVDRTELWLRRYVDHAETTPFSIASTLRQFREIWGLGPHGAPGSTLLPILERRLAQFGAMSIPVDSRERYADQQGFERVFGDASFVSFGKYRTGLTRAAAVCRVENAFGEPQGTGFLVNGRDLGPGLPDEPVVLTNAHVVSQDFPNAIRAEKARFAFYGLPPQPDGRPQFHVSAAREILWNSPPAVPPTANALDTTIVRLKGGFPDVISCPIAAALPLRGGKARVLIIGHPGGGGLSFSLNNNELIDYDQAGPRVHYRAPTEGGSSGSPVFNSDWEVIAIHHAGEDSMQSIDGQRTYEANEGIWIQSLRGALRDCS